MGREAAATLNDAGILDLTTVVMQIELAYPWMRLAIINFIDHRAKRV